jgi:hypothetical protein
MECVSRESDPFCQREVPEHPCDQRGVDGHTKEAKTKAVRGKKADNKKR